MVSNSPGKKRPQHVCVGRGGWGQDRTALMCIQIFCSLKAKYIRLMLPDEGFMLLKCLHISLTIKWSNQIDNLIKIVVCLTFISELLKLHTSVITTFQLNRTKAEGGCAVLHFNTQIWRGKMGVGRYNGKQEDRAWRHPC